MTQILNEWGLGDKLSSVSTPIKQMTLLDGLSQSPFPENVHLTISR